MSENDTPHVEAIFTAPSKGEPQTSHESIQAVAGKGLAGDRYLLGTGYYSGNKIWDAQITFMAREALDAVNAAQSRHFTAEMLRRNVITKNVNLKELVGKRFRIGEAIFEGWKDWPPCSYISAMNDCDELIKLFGNTTGIGASVIEGGRFGVGDAIELLESEAATAPADAGT